MGSKAMPRLAHLTGIRGSLAGRNNLVLVTRITEGPQSEKGRAVHVTLTTADLDVLRDAVKRLEATA